MTGTSLRSVVVVNDHGFVNGGAAKVAIESALWLRLRGLDVSFVAGVGPVDPRLEEAGIESIAVGEHDILTDPDRRRAAQNGLWNREAARVLSRHIGQRDPRTTVVHLHSWSKSLSPSVGPVVTGSPAPHVFTLHDYFLACPNGGFFDHTSGRVCHKPAMGLRCLTTQCDARNGAHKAWRVAREAVLWSAGRMPRGLREVIYLMPKQRSIMGGYLAGDTRWHLLHNPVAGSPQERVRVEENDAFLFVGRLSPEKGAVLAARAARLAGVRIVFAGEGEDREAIRRANPDAELLGWLEAGELGRWMARARCLVFPSVWYEGFGLVVADALRMGVPVLVSDSTVATDMVSDGVNGLHVAAGDVEAWARAMTRMVPDDTARDFGVAAFRAGQGLMGYEEYTDRLIGIYESVLARRQAGFAMGEVAPA